MWCTLFAMVGEWPEVSERVRELFRQGAETALAQPPEVLLEISRATLSGIAAATAVEDPDIVAASLRVNAANLRTWASANVTDPGRPVRAEIGEEALELTRELVRRGLDAFALDSFRSAQSTAWRLWMWNCFALTSDPAELHPLLDVSSVSISTFVGDLLQATLRCVEEEREALTRGRHGDRLACVSLLLEGASMSRARAEERLGHPLLGTHTAAVIWQESATTAAGVPTTADVAELVATTCGVSRRLVVSPSATTSWLWMTLATPVDVLSLEAVLADLPGVRVTLGRPARGMEGFTRSHLDAVAASRLVSRLGSSAQGEEAAGRRVQVVSYADVHLVDLLSHDLRRADEFVADTLGEFASASVEDHETVRVWIRSQCNATAVARAMFTHRNSVLRRLARADELLPRPVQDRMLEVGSALELLRLRA